MKSIDYIIVINTASKGVDSNFIVSVKKALKQQNLKNISTRILLTQGPNIQTVLKRVVKMNPLYIIACGGDGTVRAVAEVASIHNIVMGILPAGTLNHFARSLHIPQKIDEAVHLLFSNNIKKRLDVGVVNGYVFVNNSSLGMYSKLVKKREAWQQRYPKYVALVFSAVWQLFHIKRTHYIAHNNFFNIDGRYSLIFIGNGDYYFKNGAFRRSLEDSSVLSIYLFGGTNVFHLIQSLLVLIFVRSNNKTLVRKEARTITFFTKKRAVSVALDGEVLRLTTPLEYSVRKNALIIITPKRERANA